MMPKQRFHATVLAPRHAHDMLIDSDIGARLGDCRGHIPRFRRLGDPEQFGTGRAEHAGADDRCLSGSEERMLSAMAPLLLRLNPPAVIHRWNEIKHVFVPAFRDYIDGQIMLVGGGVDGV
jgi:hypothetical protein